MSAVSVRTRVTTERRFTIPTPAVIGDLRALIRDVELELGDRASWDDSATVESDEDEIIVTVRMSTVDQA